MTTLLIILSILAAPVIYLLVVTIGSCLIDGIAWLVKWTLDEPAAPVTASPCSCTANHWQSRATKLETEVGRWQAKCAQLKTENNALRRRLYRQTRVTTPEVGT